MISSSSSVALAALSATDDDNDSAASSFLDRTIDDDDDDDEDGVVIPPSFFPSSSPLPKANKSGDFYSNDELQTLLSLHSDLVETVPDFLLLNEKDDRSNSDNSDEDNDVVAADSSSSLLQDLIVQTVQEINSDEEEEEERKNDQPPATEKGSSSESNDNQQKRNKMGIKSASSSSSSSLKFFDTDWDLTEFRKVLPNIRCIACDVDGTLLASDHTLPKITQLAIQNAIQSSSFSPLSCLQHFFLATGKTRTGALSSLGQDMKNMLQQIPGVFVQGLYCIDATGNVVFEKKLSHKAVVQTEILAREFFDESTTTTTTSASSASSALLSVIAYDGDGLYASSSSSHPHHLREAHERWGEPIPVVLENNNNNNNGTLLLSEYEPGFHKLLLMMHDTDKLQNVVRPALEELATSLGDCVVTQAIPTMLELLPAGCSKSVGVEKLCQHLFLGSDDDDDDDDTARAFLSKHVCAIGDAENDMELLQRAALGIAVGNASPMVKEIADVVMHETNDEGGAGRAIEWFGLGKLLDVMDSETKQTKSL